MSPVTVVATVKRNSKGYFVDIVIVEIGGIAFETRANSPEHARELMERTLKELNLWQSQ
jgi:hypothetical protein